MDVGMRPYEAGLKDDWDEFVVNRSRNGTIFHERNFLEYHPPERFTDASVVFYKKGKDAGKIMGVFPCVLSKGEGRSGLVSHPGSSYGGLVYGRGASTRQVMEMIEGVITHAKSLGAGSVEMRLAENLIFSDPPDQEQHFLLWHRGFNRKTLELSVAVNLSSSARLAKTRSSLRWSIGRAVKAGVTVETNRPAEEAYGLIEKNLATRYGKKPAHSLEELKELKLRYPDRIQFWSAMQKGECIGTAVIFDANKKAVHVFYTAQDYSHSGARPLYALFSKALEHYAVRGFEYFNFGISSRGDWIKWGILEFKEGFGARGVTRETWVTDRLDAPKPHDGPPEIN